MVFLNRQYDVLFELKREFRSLEKEIDQKEMQLLKLNHRFEQKRVSYKELSKKFGNDIRQIRNFKQLKTSLKEEQLKNQKLEKRVIAEPQKLKIPVEKSVAMMSDEVDNNGMAEIRQKYPALPKNQLERIEVERTIARYLMHKNNGCFHVSQILRTIEELYSRNIKPNDRIMLLNETKSWIERDPLCKSVKTTDKIQHYTFI